jgi:hypothetical protein
MLYIQQSFCDKNWVGEFDAAEYIAHVGHASFSASVLGIECASNDFGYRISDLIL